MHDGIAKIRSLSIFPSKERVKKSDGFHRDGSDSRKDGALEDMTLR